MSYNAGCKGTPKGLSYNITPKYYQKVLTIANNTYTFIDRNVNFVQYQYAGKSYSKKWSETIQCNLNHEVGFDQAQFGNAITTLRVYPTQDPIHIFISCAFFWEFQKLDTH